MQRPCVLPPPLDFCRSPSGVLQPNPERKCLWSNTSRTLRSTAHFVQNGKRTPIHFPHLITGRHEAADPLDQPAGRCRVFARNAPSPKWPCTSLGDSWYPGSAALHSATRGDSGCSRQRSRRCRARFAGSTGVRRRDNQLGHRCADVRRCKNRLLDVPLIGQPGCRFYDERQKGVLYSGIRRFGAWIKMQALLQ